MPVIVVSTPCKKCGSFERYAQKCGLKCRLCTRAAQKRYALANLDKVRVMAREVYRRNRQRSFAQSRAWRLAHPDEAAAIQRRYLDKHPERKHLWQKLSPDVTRGSNAVHRALRSGALVRPGYCNACGIVCKPEAAHSDYQKPLDVRWLCRSCHRRWDLEEPKSMYSRTRRLMDIS